MALFNASQLSTSIEFTAVVGLDVVFSVARSLAFSLTEAVWVWSEVVFAVEEGSCDVELVPVWVTLLAVDVALVKPLLLLLVELATIDWPDWLSPLSLAVTWEELNWLTPLRTTCWLCRLVDWLELSTPLNWSISLLTAAWTGFPLIMTALIAETSNGEYNHSLPALYIL